MLPGRRVIAHLGALLPRKHILDGEGTERVFFGARPRTTCMSLRPRTLIHRTVDHSGRCRSMKSGKSTFFLDLAVISIVVDTGYGEPNPSRSAKRRSCNSTPGGNADGVFLRR